MDRGNKILRAAYTVHYSEQSKEEKRYLYPLGSTCIINRFNLSSGLTQIVSANLVYITYLFVFLLFLRKTFQGTKKNRNYITYLCGNLGSVVGKLFNLTLAR